MSNYIVWKDEYGNIMVEVFNDMDIVDVQKIFIEKGYYILETFGDRCGDMYFKAVEFENTKGC